MKKFCKFLFGTLSLAVIIGGAFYVFKNFINKDASDDFDDFEDDFEDDVEDSSNKDDAVSDAREYVTLNITPETDDTESADITEEAPMEAEPVSEESKDE